jgi:hypothetical protein
MEELLYCLVNGAVNIIEPVEVVQALAGGYALTIDTGADGVINVELTIA